MFKEEFGVESEEDVDMVVKSINSRWIDSQNTFKMKANITKYIECSKISFWFVG